MLEIKPLTQTDIDHISEHALEPIAGYPPCKDVPAHSYAAWVGDKLVGCGGVIPMWEGVGEGWLAVHRENSQHRELLTALCIRELLDNIIKSANLRRVQAVIRTDFAKAILLVETLGFKREGELVEFCPDKCNAYIYARII
uniref:N-acetyltransferase domain-containing protein n=1 Tax=viral metagenome TaxID=1070528 RepID=A0A6M3IIV0_9ZZZZ